MEEKRFKNYDKKDRSSGRKNFSDNQSKNSGRPRQSRDDSKGRENAVVGRNAVAELLKTGTPIDKILVSGVEGSVKVIVAKAKEARIPVVDTTSDYLDRLCGGENHQGVAALVAEKAYCTVEDILEIARERGEKPLIVVCDGIEDPHNLGAVIRCAECEGAHGIIIPERRACGLTPAVSKASAGAIMHMAVAKVANIAQTIEKLKENGVWTYSLEDIWTGIQDCYQDMKKDVQEKYGVKVTKLAAIGFSAMMHGYMAFDKDDKILVPFRTWRNAITEEASEKLTDLFQYNIPQRWSVAHLYQAILNGEEHVKDICFQTTLAGYIHWMLTGKKVLGVGDASGMFPIDIETGKYDAKMVSQFDEAIADKGYPWKLMDIFPEVLSAGEDAGTLTQEGAKLLDTDGDLEAGVPL